MHIWVDADACPAVIKEILFRAAVRVRVPLTLAAAVVEGGATALDPRGELYGPENIGEHLSRRNFMDELRSAGQLTGGPAPFGAGDQKEFARQLDRLLARLPRPAA